AVSEGGTWLGAGDGMGTIHAWNTTTSRSLYRLSAHVGEVTALVVDPLGKWFASAGADGAVKMWRLDTGALIATLMAWPNGWAVLSPDGRYKISGEVGDFWWASGLCRFGVSDLDDLAPYLHSLRRIPEDEPLDLGN
ncbi:WD40 repeat domain-containing protein, partial [Kibdelosporangium lantanae]